MSYIRGEGRSQGTLFPVVLAWHRPPVWRWKQRPPIHIVADAGYSNGEQAGRLEAAGLVPHVPATRAVLYQAQASDCGNCSLKPRCTQAPQRMLSRHIDEDALNRMHQRATPEIMRLRRSAVEHPFATLKYRIFGHPPLPAPRLGRLWYPNKPRGNGIQHQADGQPTRRNNPNPGATTHLRLEPPTLS